MSRARSIGASIVLALIDPRAAVRANPPIGPVTAVLFVLMGLIGAAGIPRQATVLRAALAPTGNALQDSHYAAMSTGLTRLMVVDRLVPSPTLLVAALLFVGFAEPVLAVARDQRRAVWALAVLGLAPLLAQQVGELAITWLAPVGPKPTPGDALDLPHRFETGFLLFWRAPTPPPLWVEIVDARLNLISLWSLFVWTLGIGALTGEGFRPWHAAVPAAGLACAGIATWLTGPFVLNLVLGRP